MVLTAEEIARRLGGCAEGNAAVEIRAVAALDEARPGDLSFLSNPRYGHAVATTAASAVLVNEGWTGATRAVLIRVKNADAAFAQVAAWLARPAVTFPPGIHATAVLAQGVALGKDVSIGAHCVIEAGARIGDRTVLGAGCYIGHEVVIGGDCLFHPGVAVREYCRIGDRAILHCGAVIGSDGFGYVKQKGHWVKVPQVGIVVVGDDVEIGANSTIDRARFGETRLGNGVKIDNLVQIAHNVTIGNDSAIAALVGIAGSAHIGARVMFGGQAGMVGHVKVGDDAVVAAQGGVTKDIKPGTFVSGFPAVPHSEDLKTHAHIMRLPELKARVAELEKRLKATEGRT